MRDYEIKALVELLQTQLAESDKMWDDKVSHAQIVGYLQGTVKGVINHLEGRLK